MVPPLKAHCHELHALKAKIDQLTQQRLSQTKATLNTREEKRATPQPTRAITPSANRAAELKGQVAKQAKQPSQKERVATVTAGPSRVASHHQLPQKRKREVQPTFSSDSASDDDSSSDGEYSHANRTSSKQPRVPPQPRPKAPTVAPKGIHADHKPKSLIQAPLQMTPRIKKAPIPRHHQPQQQPRPQPTPTPTSRKRTHAALKPVEKAAVRKDDMDVDDEGGDEDEDDDPFTFTSSQPTPKPNAAKAKLSQLLQQRGAK